MISNQQKISIITVVYNADKYIQQTLESILKQTYKCFELIIIDGGSTDNTLNIINSYNNDDITVISEKDKGIYDAMNKGTRLAKYEWVFFLNAGDVFASNETLSNIFNKYSGNSSILFGNTFLKSDNLEINYPNKINKLWFFNDTICHQSIFFKRQLFNEIGAFNLNYKIIADRDFLIRAINAKHRFEHVNEIVSIYDQEGFSAKNQNLYIQEQTFLRKKHFSYFDYFKYILLKYNLIISKT
jgi:glycosyltransferase involved in cell wall biosynthesis